MLDPVLEELCAKRGLVWTGKYVETTWTDWWCPTTNRWESCPGPCPDGTPHLIERTTPSRAKLLKLKDD